MVALLKTFGLFALTAPAEILGCHLPYPWLRQGHSAWLLVPAVASLVAFVWLLTLYPQAAGRVYAAYGGVYVSVALLWLGAVDSIRLSWTDWLGVAVVLSGMATITVGPRQVGAGLHRCHFVRAVGKTRTEEPLHAPFDHARA